MVRSRFSGVYAVLHPMARYVSKPPIFAAFAGFSANSADIQVPLKSQGLARVRRDRSAVIWEKIKLPRTSAASTHFGSRRNHRIRYGRSLCHGAVRGGARR